MRGKLQKWGNSTAVRLPVKALEDAHLARDQEVDIQVIDGALVIRAVKGREYSLDDLLAGISDGNLHEPVEFGGIRGSGSVVSGSRVRAGSGVCRLASFHPAM